LRCAATARRYVSRPGGPRIGSPRLDRVFEATKRPKLAARAKRWRKALDQRLAAL
jgi:hypothetical protein